jgi:heparan-sulfate lyase
MLVISLLLLLAEESLIASERRLEPKRLFSLLNLDAPGMGEVKAAAGAGDFGRAEEELLNYMRNRKNVKTVSPWRKRLEYQGRYASKEDIVIADDALRHLFGGHPGDHERLFPAQQFGKDIDWKSNAIKDREWIWHFNMMPFWRTLARAYWHTGDEKYAREFFRQINDWVARNPPDGNHTSWRRIDAGIRTAGSWPNAYFHFLTSPSLTPHIHTHILLGFYEHAVYLHSGRFTSMNHGLFEARGLFFISVLFPEFKDAKAWRKNSLEHLTEQILKQVGSDGGHHEKCTYYHRACIYILQSVFDLAKLNDVQVPESYAQRLEKMYEFSMLISLPDRTAPRIGDTWQQSDSKLLTKGAELFKRKDMEYVATAGAKGTAPEATSVCLEPSGFCLMRDGWDEKSQYLLMKWKYGGWHSHFDDLSIILASAGRVLLDDSSTIDYHGGGRPKSRATCSHSTIAIAGKDRPSSLNQTRLNQWLRKADIEYVDASGPASRDGHIHRRRIAYVRGKYWVMIDDVHGKEKGIDRVDMYFQFAPCEVRIDGLTARTDFKDGANLIVKVMEVPGLTAHKEDGWIAVKYKVVKPRPRVRFSVKRLPIRLVSLLYPYEGKAPDIGMERLRLSENVEKKGVLGLRIKINGEEQFIFFAPAGCEFSCQGIKLVGPVACHPGG